MAPPGAITAPSTRRHGPDPSLAIPKNPDDSVFQTGARTYREGIATGIILGDTYLSGLQFRLVATGQVP